MSIWLKKLWFTVNVNHHMKKAKEFRWYWFDDIRYEYHTEKAREYRKKLRKL